MARGEQFAIAAALPDQLLDGVNPRGASTQTVCYRGRSSPRFRLRSRWHGYGGEWPYLEHKATYVKVHQAGRIVSPPAWTAPRPTCWRS